VSIRPLIVCDQWQRDRRRPARPSEGSRGKPNVTRPIARPPLGNSEKSTGLWFEATLLHDRAARPDLYARIHLSICGTWDDKSRRRPSPRVGSEKRAAQTHASFISRCASMLLLLRVTQQTSRALTMPLLFPQAAPRKRPWPEPARRDFSMPKRAFWDSLWRHPMGRARARPDRDIHHDDRFARRSQPGQVQASLSSTETNGDRTGERSAGRKDHVRNCRDTGGKKRGLR
jgi:hypothetical protein